MNFVSPYGLVVPPTSHSSVIGKTFGSPYTVALDENTNFLHPCSPITFNKFNVESKLFK